MSVARALAPIVSLTRHPLSSPGCVGYVAGSKSWAGSLVATSSQLFWTDGTGAVGLASAGIVSFTGLPTTVGPVGGLLLATTYKPYGFVFSSASSIWATETTALTTNNIAQYTAVGSTWTRQTPTSAMLLESGATIISIAGRLEGCGMFMVYATSPTKLYSYNTVTNTASVLATASTNTKFRGVTTAPYTGAAPTFAGTCPSTPTSSVTSASTSTSTPTSSVPPPPFVSTNLAVVRVGTGSTAIVAGTAQAVFVDQYTTVASQSAPVFSYPVSGTNACTLSAGTSTTWLYDQEGIPSLASTGAFLVFPCYLVTAGTALAVTATKVAAIVSFTAFMSTATTATISTGAGSTTVPLALRTTVSDGNGVWWALQTGTTPYSTMQYQAVGTTSATLQCDYSNFVVGSFWFVFAERFFSCLISPSSLPPR